MLSVIVCSPNATAPVEANTNLCIKKSIKSPFLKTSQFTVPSSDLELDLHSIGEQ